MLSPITDRNILFGVFALQTGFITRQALVTALTTSPVSARDVGRRELIHEPIRAPRAGGWDALVYRPRRVWPGGGFSPYFSIL